jgi:hypothetical protein
MSPTSSKYSEAWRSWHARSSTRSRTWVGSFRGLEGLAYPCGHPRGARQGKVAFILILDIRIALYFIKTELSQIYIEILEVLGERNRTRYLKRLHISLYINILFIEDDKDMTKTPTDIRTNITTRFIKRAVLGVFNAEALHMFTFVLK